MTCLSKMKMNCKYYLYKPSLWIYPQSGIGSALEISSAIQPEDIHEAMRRYHHCIGPFSSHIVSVVILANFLLHACTHVYCPHKNIPVFSLVSLVDFVYFKHNIFKQSFLENKSNGASAYKPTVSMTPPLVTMLQYMEQSYRIYRASLDGISATHDIAPSPYGSFVYIRSLMLIYSCIQYITHF